MRDLQLQNLDFEMDSKLVVDSVYGKRIMNLDFGAIINDCCTLHVFDLVTSDVRFIRRQANEVVHRLARASFHIFINIPSCIETLIINEMH